MSSGLTYNNLMAGARAIVLATTPDVEPSIAFEEAPYSGPLERQSFSDPWEATRKFHVTYGVIRGMEGPGFGMFSGGTLHHLKDTFNVEILYWVPLRDGGWSRLQDLVATDAQQIIWRLAWKDDAWGSNRHPSKLDPRAVQLLPIAKEGGDQPDMWLLRITLETHTFLGE